MEADVQILTPHFVPFEPLCSISFPFSCCVFIQNIQMNNTNSIRHKRIEEHTFNVYKTYKYVTHFAHDLDWDFCFSFLSYVFLVGMESFDHFHRIFLGS